MVSDVHLTRSKYTHRVTNQPERGIDTNLQVGNDAHRAHRPAGKLMVYLAGQGMFEKYVLWWW